MNKTLSDIAVIAAGALLALAALAWLASLARRHANRVRIVTAGLLVPAGMGLALSASTSYRFFAQHLGVTDVPERMALCGVAEAVILGFTLHSWGTGSKSSAWVAYLFVAAQAIPAFEVSGGAGGIVRIVLGPLALAISLHRLLGIEAKLSGMQSTGLLASAAREIRERLTARLGIGRRGADSAEIARSRAADRAVRLASRRKLGNRGAARLAVAIDAARHGLDEADADAAEAEVVARVVRRKSVAGLHAISVRHVWRSSLAPFQTVPDTVPGTAMEAAQEAAEPSLQPLAPVIYPLPQRPALPSFQPVPGSFKPQVVPFPSDEERARAMRDKGLSYGEIAERLERSKSWAFRACAAAVPHANGSISTD